MALTPLKIQHHFTAGLRGPMMRMIIDCKLMADLDRPRRDGRPSLRINPLLILFDGIFETGSLFHS